MVSFKCVANECAQKDIVINFMGDITEAECGGCQIVLTSYDLQDDPKLPATVFDI